MFWVTYRTFLGSDGVFPGGIFVRAKCINYIYFLRIAINFPFS